MSNCEWVSEWSHFSCVWLFAILWTVAHQTLLSMGFSRQEYWSGLPFSSPEDLPDPGIELRFPTRQVDSLPSEPPKNPISNCDALSIYLASQKKKKKKLLLWEVKGFFKKKMDLHIEEMGGIEGTMPAAVSTRVPHPGEGTRPNKQLSGVCQMALVTAAALPRVGLCYRLCGVESWIQIPFLCLWPVEQACLAQIALE